MNNELHIVISGGGTGGHIFPAVSIANALKEAEPSAKILFVGAEGRMEMTRVPQAGYEIVGLPICGFNRQQLWRNITLPWKMWKSDRMVRRVLKEFQPDAAVGVGGYASYPTLAAAASMGIPCLIQEQNSFAGKANKMLGPRVERICVAYEGMERFFPKEKIMLTGNPVRQQLLSVTTSQAEAREAMGLERDRRTVLLVGGSLGARTINESVMQHLDQIAASPLQFVWQTGKYYSAQIAEELKQRGCPTNLHPTDFIVDMGVAYKAADLVVSRAGASSISEFCLIGKPVILVPSPNVAEDHQTKNAQALATRNAALMVTDADAPQQLIDLAIATATDDSKLQELSTNVLKMALPDSAAIIAREVIKIARKQ